MTTHDSRREFWIIEYVNGKAIRDEPLHLFHRKECEHLLKETFKRANPNRSPSNHVELMVFKKENDDRPNQFLSYGPRLGIVWRKA